MSAAKVEVVGTELHLIRPNLSGVMEKWAMEGIDLGTPTPAEAPGTLYIEHGRIIYWDWFGHKRMIKVEIEGPTAADRLDSSLNVDPVGWLWYAWQKQRYAVPHMDADHNDWDDYSDEPEAQSGYHFDWQPADESYHTDYDDWGDHIDSYLDWTDPPNEHGDKIQYIHTDWPASPHSDWDDTSYDDWTDESIHDDWTDEFETFPHADYTAHEDWDDSGYPPYVDWNDGYENWGDYAHIDWSDDAGYHTDDYANLGHYGHNDEHDDYANWGHGDNVYYADSPHLDWGDYGDAEHSDAPRFIGYQ